MQNYNSKVKIIFFGSSEYVIPIIKSLQKNFDLGLVLTTENPKTKKSNLASRGEASQSYSVIWYCVKNKIPYRSVTNLSDPNLKLKIENLKLKIAVLADFGLIIPQEILNIFPKGIINIHPSLLPKYRGPTPVQTAILNGEKITGVSIMKLDEELDHGPVLGQEQEEILDTDTSESLYKRLFEKGVNLLPKLLNDYLNGNLNPIAQNHKNATFTKALKREDGYIDISKLEVRGEKLEVDRKIRAYFPWPGVWTKLEVRSEKLEVRIKFLPGEKIQVSGKKPMSYKDFLNGYPELKQQLGKLLE